MAGAVYQTKLTADTSQHDQALGKSAKQVYNYKKNCDDTDKSIGKMFGGFKKIAGVAGVAAVAMKTFKGALENSTSAADTYGSTMASLSRITEEFQRSIATLDFSNIWNGLGDLISRANEYYNALDDLQTLQTSLIGDNARLNAELEDARRRYKAGDESAGDDLRKIGQDMANNVQAERDALKKELDAYVRSKTSVTVRIKGSNQRISKTAGDFRSIDDIQKLLRNQDRLRQAVSGAEHIYKDYVKKLKKDNDQIFGHWVEAAQLEAEWKSLKALQEAMGDDKGLEHFEQNYARYYSLAGEYERTMSRVDQMLRKDEKSTKPTTHRTITAKVEVQLPEGSIAEAEKRLNDLREQFRMASSDEGDNGRNALKKKIEEAEDELRKLKNEMEDLPAGSLAQWEHDLKVLQQQWRLAPSDADRATIQKAIDDVQKEIDRINGVVTVPIKPKTPRQELQELIDDLRYQMAMAETPEIRMAIGFNIDQFEQDLARLDEAMKTPAEKLQDRIEELKKGFEEMGDMCTSVCDAMGAAFTAFANTGDEATDRNLRNTGTLISQFGSLIPKVLSMVAAYQAEAMAAGTASAAAIGFPQNIAAIASIVAELMAIFGTIASFSSKAYAGGGIIEGASRIGDMNIARVNAGEMILNNRQQANLFRLLNGEVGPQVRGTSGGSVTFHISGTDLVGVLDNQDRKTKRVR